MSIKISKICKQKANSSDNTATVFYGRAPEEGFYNNVMITRIKTSFAPCASERASKIRRSPRSGIRLR